MSFTASRVTRESLVTQSVLDYIKDVLFNRKGYPTDGIEFLPSFQTNLFEDEIAKSYVAEGFHEDDGGVPAEMGSTFRKKEYRLEYWVVGLNEAQGSNVAAAISEAIESDDVIPLRDYREPGAPVVDFLLTAPVIAKKVPVADPAPWQEHLYQLVIPVIDRYYP